MSILKNIFSGAAKEIIGEAGKIIDGVTTTDLEKAGAKEKLYDVISSRLTELATLQHNVLLAEAKGSWIQRSWRPLVMLSFAGIVVYEHFISPVFGTPQTALPDQFWSLLELGLGGYVIGRSLEKISTTFAANPDIAFLRKKDRK